MAFAKIFERPTFGQVLVRLANSPEGSPGIVWSMELPCGTLVETALWAEDSEEGEDHARLWFEDADDAQADRVAASVFNTLGVPVEQG